MKPIRRDWNHFWFDRISPVPLGIFRMVFGALVVAYGLLLFPERFIWFSDHGVLSIADANTYNGIGPGPWRLNPLSLSTYDELSTFQAFGHAYVWHLSLPGSDSWLTPFFVIFLLAAVGLMLGFWTRTSSVIVYLCLSALHNRNSPIHNSGDTVMMVMSAYLILSPAGAACSLDRLWRIFLGKEGDEPPLIVPWAQRLMQVQVAVLYLCASLSKVTGQPWMDGTAAYYPMHLPESVRFPTWGTDNIYVINAVTWGTMVIEMSLAALVWVSRLRLYVLAGGVLLHLGIEYSMNIPLFSFLMITSYINFLLAADIRFFLAWAKRPIGLTPLRLVYDGECDFCKSCLLVIRFLDVFRQITLIDSHDADTREAAGVRFADAEEAAIAVRPEGQQYAGFDAFRLIAWQLPLTALFTPLLYIPGIPQLGRRAYTWIKNNRSRLPVAPRYKTTRAETRTPVEV